LSSAASLGHRRHAVSVASIAKAGMFATRWYQRRLRADRFPGVLVLCYHGVRTLRWDEREPSFPDLHVSPETLDAQCAFIASSCDPIALEDWRKAVAGERPLPARPVLVTFDDGYRSVFDIARPILKSHGIPALLFLSTDPIEYGNLFWYDAAAREGRAMAVEEYRRTGRFDAREQCLARPASPDDPLAPMTADHVRALADDGFEIGAHTATHVRLSAVAEDEQRRELVTSRDRLSAWTGRRVRAFAYPFGAAADYSSDTVRLLRELEFDCAFTTRTGYATAGEPPFERSRFLVLAEVSAPEFAHRITYSWRP
jgi:peptidoglycan/xylan/chitin deacetylase (PgdA/CDA1 family)